MKLGREPAIMSITKVVVRISLWEKIILQKFHQLPTQNLLELGL